MEVNGCRQKSGCQHSLNIILSSTEQTHESE